MTPSEFDRGRVGYGEGLDPAKGGAEGGVVDTLSLAMLSSVPDSPPGFITARSSWKTSARRAIAAGITSWAIRRYGSCTGRRIYASVEGASVHSRRRRRALRYREALKKKRVGR
jgi:hypothetical protein